MLSPVHNLNIITPKRFHSIAIPIVVQSILVMSMSFIDTMIVTPINNYMISALSISSAILLSVFSIQQGLSQAVLIRCVNYRLNKYARDPFIWSIFHGLAMSICISVFLLSSLDIVSSLLTADQLIREYIFRYLSYMVFTIPLTTVTLCIGFFLRANGNSSISMMGFFIEIPVNITISIVLVYFYNQGIVGVAIGSLIGRVFRFIWMTVALYRTHKYLFSKITFNKEFFQKWTEFARFATSLAMTSFGLGTSNVVFVLILSQGHFFEFSCYAYLASFQLVIISIANATASTVTVFTATQTQSEKTTFVDYEHFYLGVNLCLSYIIPSVLILTTLSITYYIIFVKSINSIVYPLLLFSLCSYSSAFFKAVNSVLINGFVKAFGDTRFPLITEQILNWLICVPTSFLLVHIFDAPLFIPIMVCTILDFFYLNIIIRRLRKTNRVADIKLSLVDLVKRV